jgi:hypothetical protein
MNSGDPIRLSGADLRRRHDGERHNARRRHIARGAPDMTRVTGLWWSGSDLLQVSVVFASAVMRMRGAMNLARVAG